MCSSDLSIAGSQQHNEHEDAPRYGKTGEERAQFVALYGSVYFLNKVYHMCVLLFHETVLPKRRRIMVEIFFDAFDKTIFDMDNLVGLVGNATLVGDNHDG